MSLQQEHIKFNQFRKEDKNILDSVLTHINGSGISIQQNIFNSILPADILLSSIIYHKAEHGTGICYITNEQQQIIGIAGLCLVSDVSIYEVFYYLLPGYNNNTQKEAVINLLVDKAFYELGLDKVCARTIIEDHDSSDSLLACGFNYIDERAFEEDGHNAIWNYYELENDSNIITADNDAAFIYDDWDTIF